MTHIHTARKILMKFFDRLKRAHGIIAASKDTRLLSVVCVSVVAFLLITIPLTMILLSASPSGTPPATTNAEGVSQPVLPANEAPNKTLDKTPSDPHTAEIKNIYRRIQLAEIQEEFLKHKISVEKMKKELGAKGENVFEEHENNTHTSPNGFSDEGSLPQRTYAEGERRDYRIILIFVDKSSQEPLATITDGQKIKDVRPNDVLEDGTKVIAISPDAVIFEHNNVLYKKEVDA